MKLNTTRTRESRLWWTNLEDLAFLVYLCAATANQTGEGFDALFVRAAFVVYFVFIILRVATSNAGIKLNGYLKWLLLFYGYMALSFLWADQEFAYDNNTQFIQIFGMVIGLSQRIRTMKDIRRYLFLYYLATLYFILLLYIKTPAWEWGTGQIGEALGSGRNGVGLYAAKGFVISLYYILGTNDRKWRIVNAISMVLFATVAVLSTSRKGFMMLPVGLVVYWVLYEKRNWTQLKGIGTVVIGTIVVSLILWYGYNYIMNSDLVIAKRIAITSDIFIRGEVSEDASYDERQFYIYKAYDLFLRNPIIGAGSNGFCAYMKEIHYGHIAYCHNNFLELLSTLGIIGFLIYYYMHAKCLYYGWPWRMRVQNIRPLAAVFWTLIAINVVFGWWYVYYYDISGNFFFILGYMALYVNGALPESRKVLVR